MFFIIQTLSFYGCNIKAFISHVNITHYLILILLTFFKQKLKKN